MVFQILRKKVPAYRRYAPGELFFLSSGSVWQQVRTRSGGFGVKSHSLFPSAEGDVKAHSQTAGLSRSRRPRTVQVRGFFKPRRSTY